MSSQAAGPDRTGSDVSGSDVAAAPAPSRRHPTALAVTLAVPVHLVTAAVAAAGVALLWPGTDFFQKILGVGCLLVVLALRPTPLARARDATRIDLARAPETAALVREVARVVGTAAPRRVEVTGDVRADLRVSPLGPAVVSIGAPLWLTLTGPERVALLGHELGHLSHGAGRTRRLTEGAVHTLARWETLATGGRPGPGLGPADLEAEAIAVTQGRAVAAQTRNNLLGDLAALVLWPVRAAAAAYRRLILRALRPALHQQALEADRAAVRVAGPAATTALLEVLLALPGLEASIGRAAAARSDLAAAILDWRAGLDAGGRSAPAASDGARAVDDAHPATARRLAGIAGIAGTPAGAAVEVPAVRRQAIDRELADAVAVRIERLRDDYLYPR